MIFNSITFGIFLPLVFLAYWFVFQKNIKVQNLFILIASYVFYGWWDWRFLILIVISSASDYILGLKIHQQQKERSRKQLLWLSFAVNLGMLGFFKYYNFFGDSLREALAMFGYHISDTTLHIILPVGISFYTFQTLSYTIDIYRRKLEPTTDVLAFFAFVSFFPQLVAGPIERASRLLPQFQSKREFDRDKAKDGMRQILLGLVKKVVIADNMGIYVEQIFDTPGYENTDGVTLILGSVFFVIQVYCDFSGYSDIAIGTARLMGFNLMKNFAYPLLSRTFGEFWQRWNISLSTWFRDYLFIPLGGSRVSTAKIIRNILITYTVSGLWHGANWTFVVWGFLLGTFYIPLIWEKTKGKYDKIVAYDSALPSLKEFLLISFTFALHALTAVFFRSQNIGRAWDYLVSVFTNFTLKGEVLAKWVESPALLYVLGLLIFEWIQRRREHALEIADFPKWLRWIIYVVFMALFVYAGQFSAGQQFIYFQF